MHGYCHSTDPAKWKERSWSLGKGQIGQMAPSFEMSGQEHFVPGSCIRRGAWLGPWLAELLRSPLELTIARTSVPAVNFDGQPSLPTKVVSVRITSLVQDFFRPVDDAVLRRPAILQPLDGRCRTTHAARSIVPTECSFASFLSTEA